MDYRYGNHTVFKIQYHFVFETLFLCDFGRIDGRHDKKLSGIILNPKAMIIVGQKPERVL
jgi:hypothetical protein